MLIDCHTHLDQFSDTEVAQILGRARASGIRLVVSAGITLESSSRSVEISSKFAEVFSGIGIHPMDLNEHISENTYFHLYKLATSTKKVLVVSEIGLDFIEEAPDRMIQYQAFRTQINLAIELDLPIIFHSRDSHKDTLRVLREERAYEVGGAMHYFQDDLKTAYQTIDLGFYISMAKPLLRLPKLQKVAAVLPLEKIVIESDTAPQTFKMSRQKWTEPRHVRDIAQKIADLQKKSLEEVEHITSQNFLTMIGSRQNTVNKMLRET